MSGIAAILSRAQRLPIVLRTVRHVRPAQALAQLRHMWVGVPDPVRLAGVAPSLAVPRAHTAFLPPPAHLRGGPREAELLATRFSPVPPIDWDSLEHGPLFAYHLHQHDYLRLERFDPEARGRVLRDWIDRHPRGIGWDPHPISLRLLCWGRLLLTPGALAADPALRGVLLRSMADQAATLAQGLEVRLQANHLLSNLLSLVWAGVLLDVEPARAWRAYTDRLLDELDAQVLPDGGHEERSPMYHSLLLENVLDLLNLCRAAEARAPQRLAEGLAPTAARMLAALDAFTHPDGRIALLGDSGFDVAAEPAALREYADRLGVSHSGNAQRGSMLLSQTGILRLTSGAYDLIASVAGPSPAHQPGHAHCDALGFELSVAGRRLVTDTGLFEYRPGARRELARSTASHATLMIDDAEQAEIWAAHRVGGRPRVELTGWDAGGRAEASCRGWSRGAPVHRRRFCVEDAGVSIEDRVEGDCREVVTRLPLAPDWQVELVPGGARARSLAAGASSLVVRFELPDDARFRIETAAYYPSFGVEQPRPVLVGRGGGPVAWTIGIRVEP